MTLTTTLIAALGFLTAAVFCGWRGAQPWNPAKGPRMIPWRPLMLLSAFGLLIMLVHLANLMGVQTGR